MPHESSAVADLVSLAHREPIHASPDPGDPNFGGRGDKSGLSAPWIVVIGLVVIGASVAGGYLMARQEEPASNTASTAAASIANTEIEPDLQAVGRVEAAARVETDAEAGEEEIEPEPSGQLGEVDIELAKVTGFDVLVEPSGAKVSLDGQAIGAAPLRVRNLLPGKHAIDIEGPNGYFGKHLEFDLQAGDAEVLNLMLQAVGDAPPPVTETEPIAGVAGSGDSDEDQGAPEIAEVKKPAKTKRRNKNDKNKRDRRRFKASADEEKILDKAEKVALGTLMLGAKPPCDIIINGKQTGLVTPQRAIQLPAGMHRVILVNKKFKIRKSFKVNIKSGMTTRAIQDLSAEL